MHVSQELHLSLNTGTNTIINLMSGCETEDRTHYNRAIWDNSVGPAVTLVSLVEVGDVELCDRK